MKAKEKNRQLKQNIQEILEDQIDILEMVWNRMNILVNKYLFYFYNRNKNMII